MSDEKKVNVSIDLSGFFIFALIVLFWGDPDLADALIHWLMKQ